MLVKSVTAHAFGPLVGERLEFADAMTVVHGANESAKSSWHAAIYAALCGRRRGRAPSAEERHFAELHRPWDRDDWVVNAEVLLDDGRRLEVRQDLAGRVECDVRDLDLGRDCSDEFIKDGTPDLARWLGLDRHSFLATACVAQAQVLAIHNRAGGLQEQLQRAAATAGADQTAAAALAHIDAFRRDQVGTDRATTRPLRLAGAAVTRAEAALAGARAAHTAYQQRLIEVDRLRAAAGEAERRLRRHEAVAAGQAARSLRQRAGEVDSLLTGVGEREPGSSVADESTAREVAAALSTWDSQPAAPSTDPDPAGRPETEASSVETSGLEMPSVETSDIESSSVEPSLVGPSLVGPSLVGPPFVGPSLVTRPLVTPPLVTPPSGTPPSVTQSRSVESSLVGAGVGVGAGSGAGSGPASAPLLAEESAREAGDVAAGLTDQELWDLARDLDVALPPADPRINERVVAARAKWASVDEAGKRGRRLLSGAAILAALAVVALVVGLASSGLMIVGAGVAGLLALGAVILVVAGRLASRAGDTTVTRREMDAALLDAAAALRAEQTALAHRERAQNRAQRLGLPVSADGIRKLAQNRAASIVVAEREQEWQRQVLETHRQVAESQQRIAEAQRQVLETQRRFTESQRRIAESQLQIEESRRQITANNRQIVAARQRAAEQVIAAARGCGIAADAPDAAVTALLRWQQHQVEQIAARDLALRQWSRLQSLLGLAPDAPSTEVRVAAAALRQAADDAQRVATQAANAFPAAELAGVTDTDPAMLEELREQVRAAGTEAGGAEGSRQVLERSLVSVGEAEEELDRAQAELRRLRRLDQTLELTRTFLAAAQERAHRTIAPVLVGTVGRWLPATTAGRYTDVIVDPERLRVQVRGPASRWRDAEVLSHGTAEQVYLLLRIALAQHLARPGTVCPLLLDDVTVHADTERTEQILELLLVAAQDRQIILFTQQDQVRDWARTRLAGPLHAFHTLPPLATV